MRSRGWCVAEGTAYTRTFELDAGYRLRAAYEARDGAALPLRAERVSNPTQRVH